MSEAPSADISDLWGLYQDAKGMVTALITEQTAILAALTALRTGNEPDYSSINKSEDGGSQSWSIETLRARLGEVRQATKDAIEDMKELRELAIAASPGYCSRPIRRRAFRWWGGW